MEIPPELIERCLKGDRKAENELYRQLYSFLMSICRRYIRQDEKAAKCLTSGFAAYFLTLANTGR